MRIGFIGCGKMGGAILRGILGKVFLKEDISVYELNPSVITSLKRDGIDVVSSIDGLLDKVDIVLIAIKPQDFSGLLNSLKGKVDGKLIITIAAGVKIQTIENALGSVKVARAMPNTAATLGAASSVLCFNSLLLGSDKKVAEDIFNAIGKVVLIDEGLMDDVIPIGGSFTAFEYYFYKGFLESSLKRGVPFDVAKKLLVQSIIGSAKMIENDDRDINELISDVCSKGGTTLAGLSAFEEGNLLKIVADCATRCAEGSKELGK